MIPGIVAGLPVALSGGDPYWPDVSALLHFDGANGSTTFTDQTGKTWTGVGSAQISTAQSRFGGSSLTLGNTSQISTPHSADLSCGGAQFTIEAFARFSSLRSSVIVCKVPATSARSEWMLYTSISGALTLACWGAGNALVVNLQDASNMASGTWYHVAATRDGGGVWRLFRDGVIVASATESAALATNTEPVTVGRAPYNIGNTYTVGFYDEMRITKGVARYTANFTPPIAPFPDW